MAWCCQAASHYLSLCWTTSVSPYGITRPQWVNILGPRQNGHNFTDNNFKCISLNENAWISIMLSLKSVPKGPINYIPTLVQIMALAPTSHYLNQWCLVYWRPQWVKEKHLRVIPFCSTAIISYPAIPNPHGCCIDVKLLLDIQQQDKIQSTIIMSHDELSRVGPGHQCLRLWQRFDLISRADLTKV